MVCVLVPCPCCSARGVHLSLQGTQRVQHVVHLFVLAAFVIVSLALLGDKVLWYVCQCILAGFIMFCVLVPLVHVARFV